MRNYLADYNLLAVSANAKETALNTEHALDTSMLVAKGDILSLDHRRQDNTDELTGKEEADSVYDLGSLSAGTLNFDKAQAQHFGFGLSFALGLDTPAAWGTGYKHTITPITSIQNPSFTAGQRYGSTIFKRLLASLFVDQLTATFSKDSWAKLVLACKGTGKYTDNMTKELVTAAYNATTLTLAANGVQGSDAPTRLDNVQSVRCLVPVTGEYVDVVVTAVSGATPAVLSFTAPGGAATSTTYEILYIPTEPAWCTFPARVTEPPLRVTDLVVTFGGKWNGTTFLGGHSMSQEIESIEYSLNNNYQVEFRPGGTGIYASYAMRQGRVQNLKLNRQARDYILQRRMYDNEYLGVRMIATGSEFEAAHNYFVDLVFPRCNVLKAPLSVNGKVLAEAGDISVLQDDTYGSVWAMVGNKVAAYAA